jgi:hypothetical protein
MGPLQAVGGEAGLLAITIAIGGAAIGFAWIRRITRDPEDARSSWRSQAPGSHGTGPVDRSALHPLEDGRGLRGRRTARFILFAVLGLDVGVALLLLAPANTIGPMFDSTPSLLFWLVPAIGIAINAAGLIWMIRIVRADPEGGRTSWRVLRDR